MKFFDKAKWHKLDANLYQITNDELAFSQKLTNSAFSEKWSAYDQEDKTNQEKLFSFQKRWFLELYGFGSEDELRRLLENCSYILDAGCGLGYKAAWLAELAPKAEIIAIDYSEAVLHAHRRYSNKYPNITFVKGDISDTKIFEGMVDITICDQVIMHTQDPTDTLKELARITSPVGEIFCYWYAKKALPRELLDEHFREKAEKLSTQELWSLSAEVLQLGKMLTELNVEATFPDLPSLGIKGGKMDLQRFIYWNFMKCFWNKELGYETSLSTNFDWYSPANAKRFSKKEVEEELTKASLQVLFFHQEEACYSGRFAKAP